jgi:hypothetical protein
MTLNNKDMFLLLFNAFSKLSFAVYSERFVDRLPHRLLQSGLAANPEVARCPGFQELQNVLASCEGDIWRNPELYPYLNFLNIPDSHTPDLNRSIRALRIHAGLEELSLDVAAERLFWRLRGADTKVVTLRNGSLCEIPDVVVPVSLDQGFLTTFRPYPRLFDDIQGQCYRGDGFCDVETLIPNIRKALDLIRAYSLELYCNVQRIVNTIVVMPNQATSFRSFSMRNFYIGAIFVSFDDYVSIAEQIIHEYYHQCIWPWWLIEKPADLPDDDVTVVSPITGRKRPASVMLQALLIYCSLADFYECVTSRPEALEMTEEQRETVGRRLRAIKVGITPLADALRGAMLDRPVSREVVEFVTAVRNA